MRWADLGDDPPRDRTAELRALGFPTRHLGSVQMTTDTALGVTKRIVVDRGPSLSSPLRVRRFLQVRRCDEKKKADGFACEDSPAR